MNLITRLNRLTTRMNRLNGAKCHYCGGSHGKSRLVQGELIENGVVERRYGEWMPVVDGRCKFCHGEVEVIRMELETFIRGLIQLGEV